MSSESADLGGMMTLESAFCRSSFSLSWLRGASVTVRGLSTSVEPRLEEAGLEVLLLAPTWAVFSEYSAVIVKSEVYKRRYVSWGRAPKGL